MLGFKYYFILNTDNFAKKTKIRQLLNVLQFFYFDICRKSWLLLPPDSHLTPTRIPYEESSVYCMENLYAPNADDISHLTKSRTQLYHCILEPNDVLIVPKHWWHFVEALDISLSVNAWIPLVSDIDSQIHECISKHLIETFVKGKSQLVREYVMNPNQVSSNGIFQKLV